MSNKPIRNAQFFVSQILGGAKLADMRHRIVWPERPLEWSLFVLGAIMVADQLAKPAVKAELEAFDAMIGAEMARRSHAAYDAMLGEPEVLA